MKKLNKIEQYFAAGYKAAQKQLAAKSDDLTDMIETQINEYTHSERLDECRPLKVEKKGNRYWINYAKSSYTTLPNGLGNIRRVGEKSDFKALEFSLSLIGIECEFVETILGYDENGNGEGDLTYMCMGIVIEAENTGNIPDFKSVRSTIKVEHTTEGKDQVFTDLLNKNHADIDVVVSSLGSDYRYTIRLVDEDIFEEDDDTMVDHAEAMWKQVFEPLLSKAGYETKYLVPNIGDRDGLSTLLNINFMVKKFPLETTFTRSFSKSSVKAQRDNVLIEYDDDIQNAIGDAAAMGEHWIGDLFANIPASGGKVEDTYLYDVPQFDLHYTCVVKMTMDANGEGSITIQWDDKGNGWPKEIKPIDLNVTANISEGLYTPEETELPIEFVIDKLSRWIGANWHELEASNPKAILSLKAETIPSKKEAWAIWNKAKAEIMAVVYNEKPPKKEIGDTFFDLMDSLLSSGLEVSFAASNNAQTVLDKIEKYQANPESEIQTLQDTIELVAKVIDHWPE